MALVQLLLLLASVAGIIDRVEETHRAVVPRIAIQSAFGFDVLGRTFADCWEGYGIELGNNHGFGESQRCTIGSRECKT